MVCVCVHVFERIGVCLCVWVCVHVCLHVCMRFFAFCECLFVNGRMDLKRMDVACIRPFTNNHSHAMPTKRRNDTLASLVSRKAVGKARTIQGRLPGSSSQ